MYTGMKKQTRYKLTILVENKQTLDKFITEVNTIPEILDIERLIKWKQ